MCIQKIYFLKDLARFLQKMHFLQDSKNTTLAKFLQEMRKCCKNFARFTLEFTNLRKYVFFYEYFAKVVLIAKILQDFCTKCFSCEIGNSRFTNI